jgi:hypothetical protein
MDELKPCPFAKCGGKAQNVYDREFQCWNVECRKCWLKSIDCETAEAAAAWWNDRTEPAASSPAIAPATEEKPKTLEDAGWVPIEDGLPPVGLTVQAIVEGKTRTAHRTYLGWTTSPHPTHWKSLWADG